MAGSGSDGEDGGARSVVEVVAEELGRACVGDGDDDQGDAQPVASSTDAMARSAACADVSGAGPSPAAELRSAYSFGIIALAARRTPRFRLRAPTRVMAVGRDGEAGRRTTISSPTPMVPGLLTVA